METEQKTLPVGKGDVTFTATFTVPQNAPSIMVFVACSAPSRSIMSASAMYQVR